MSPVIVRSFSSTRTRPLTSSAGGAWAREPAAAAGRSPTPREPAVRWFMGRGDSVAAAEVKPGAEAGCAARFWQSSGECRPVLGPLRSVGQRLEFDERPDVLQTPACPGPLHAQVDQLLDRPLDRPAAD